MTEQKNRAQANKAFDVATEPAWMAYMEALARATKAFKKALAQAKKAYMEATAPARKAHGKGGESND